MLEPLLPSLTFRVWDNQDALVFPPFKTLPTRDQEASNMEEAETPVKLLYTCNGRHQFFKLTTVWYME